MNVYKEIVNEHFDPRKLRYNRLALVQRPRPKSRYAGLAALADRDAKRGIYKPFTELEIEAGIGTGDGVASQLGSKERYRRIQRQADANANKGTFENFEQIAAQVDRAARPNGAKDRYAKIRAQADFNANSGTFKSFDELSAQFQ